MVLEHARHLPFHSHLQHLHTAGSALRGTTLRPTTGGIPSRTTSDPPAGSGPDRLVPHGRPTPPDRTEDWGHEQRHALWPTAPQRPCYAPYSGKTTPMEASHGHDTAVNINRPYTTLTLSRGLLNWPTGIRDTFPRTSTYTSSRWVNKTYRAGIFALHSQKMWRCHLPKEKHTHGNDKPNDTYTANSEANRNTTINTDSGPSCRNGSYRAGPAYMHNTASAICSTSCTTWHHGWRLRVGTPSSDDGVRLLALAAEDRAIVLRDAPNKKTRLSTIHDALSYGHGRHPVFNFTSRRRNRHSYGPWQPGYQQASWKKLH